MGNMELTFTISWPQEMLRIRRSKNLLPHQQECQEWES